MKSKITFIFVISIMYSFMILSCSSPSDTESNPDLTDGPWLGSWLQINFLVDDDNGVWEDDHYSGVGFYLEINEDGWAQSTIWEDDDCVRIYSYSIKKDYTFTIKGASSQGSCDSSMDFTQIVRKGKLEFSDDSQTMIQTFDGDVNIRAYKWRRVN